MSIPKTTKLTLKRIVEALPDIPANGFGTEPPKMSSEQKKKLMELSAMYENFGECLRNEEALMNAAKGITELCELAETYALNECGEWFQQEIVKKDMQNLKKRVSEFQKIVKETYARMQQAGVAYQDIGHVLGRYYDLGVAKGGTQKVPQSGGKQPLQNEDMESICAWCGKSLGNSAGDKTGKTHGICPKCKDEVMAGTWQKPGEEKTNPVSAPVSAPVSEDAGKPMYENLWNRFRSGGKSDDLKPGDDVVVTQGKFANQKGKIEKISPNGQTAYVMLQYGTLATPLNKVLVKKA